jgi:hypothetical protein
VQYVVKDDDPKDSKPAAEGAEKPQEKKPSAATEEAPKKEEPPKK